MKEKTWANTKGWAISKGYGSSWIHLKTWAHPKFSFQEKSRLEILKWKKDILIELETYSNNSLLISFTLYTAGMEAWFGFWGVENIYN